MYFRHLAAMMWVALLVALPLAAVAAPGVVATIKPLHALAAMVGGEVAVPHLLVRGEGSPHAYRLRPSDVRKLQEADLVLWVGAGLEGFMVRALRNLPETARVLRFIDHPGVAVLPAREGGAWEHDDDEHGDDEHDDEVLDPHLWLDPVNARVMVAAIADALVALDPDNAGRYRANAARARVRLHDLERQLRGILQPLRGVPLLVFHDAWQYFEKRFGLRVIGAVVVQPQSPPGARRLRELRDTIQKHKPRCVFDEPQFNPRVVAALVADGGIGHATLDPLGARVRAGAGAYFCLLEQAAATLTACAGGGDGGGARLRPAAAAPGDDSGC